jgi:hypothetical protein
LGPGCRSARSTETAPTPREADCSRRGCCRPGWYHGQVQRTTSAC